ncbi:MAG TPA: iron-containing redox enzyme family protein [Candidatus Nitrosotenuis sp.]|nr:iron-containing redox enzyme family protein [Candidatus Nitrosotenuis sp.]
MNPLSKRIDDIIEEKSLLKHPFYKMWSDGKLSVDSLAGYSKEYFQMVKAVPSFVEAVASFAPESLIPEIKENQAEEAEHIKPWINFAVSLGVDHTEITAYAGLEKTNSAVSELSSLITNLESGAVAMYAFEKEIPRISLTKLEGLDRFYNITSDDATEYFRLHMEADIRHAATWRNIIDSIPQERHDALIKVAEKSLDAQNHLLDSCYESYCQSL